jgi:hypothetical protein
MTFDQASIDRHRAAFETAKREAVCSCDWRTSPYSDHRKECAQNVSQLLRRAERIRKEMECKSTASTS